MLRIYIARHGQNIDNKNGILNGHRDLDLTKLGIEQANELASKIKSSGLVFDFIYSSPLKRAFRTAEIISKVNNSHNPIILPDLIERNFGDMTGVAQNRIEELCSPNIIKTKNIIYFLCPKDTETFPDLLFRAKKIINEIKSAHQDGNILLVTHGDFGKMIYAAYYRLEWQEVLAMFHFGNSELLLLSDNSKLNEAHVFKIKQYNS